LKIVGEQIMKNRLMLSIVFTLSVLVSTLIMPALAHGQQPLRFSSSSGVMTLAEGQALRVTASCAIGCVEELMELRFAWKQYANTGCSGSPQVCRHSVVSQGATPRETLGPDSALSFDLQGPGPVNVTVRSNSRNTKVLGIVFDTSTQRVVSICTFIPD
jgi:hypothetical protein